MNLLLVRRDEILAQMERIHKRAEYYELVLNRDPSYAYEGGGWDKLAAEMEDIEATLNKEDKLEEDMDKKFVSVKRITLQKISDKVETRMCGWRTTHHKKAAKRSYRNKGYKKAMMCFMAQEACA